MSNHVYKILELTGSSTSGIEDAVSTAIAKAGETVRNMQWFEVVETRGHIQDGKVDVIVLADTDLPEEWHSPAGLARPPAAAVDAGIPCLLLLTAVTRAAANAAHAAGFTAVMAADSAPRVVYRRLGALLQRARRIGRGAEGGRHYRQGDVRTDRVDPQERRPLQDGALRLPRRPALSAS